MERPDVDFRTRGDTKMNSKMSKKMSRRRGMRLPKFEHEMIWNQD